MNIPHEKEQRLRIQLLRQGTEWGGKRRLAAALVTVVLSVFPAAASAGLLPETSASTVSVIVRELAGAGNGPERAVRGAGGRVGRHIAIIDGFVAELPRSAVAGLRTRRDVHSVSENRPVHLNGLDGLDGWDHTHDVGSMVYIAQEVTGAGEYWNDRFTGRGVDVALIDSGVVPVNGLTTPGKVAFGPDLSFDSQADNLRFLDTFGHGTHMAGIIAGRDNAAPTVVQKGEQDHFVGVAPDARIVSIKVADAFGATDVSQVIAAIDWVVENRRSNGLNIRVLNLSFGTDGEQDYRVDPLAYAVEVAWRKGIVVVVSAGNGGYGSPKLNNPAYDPFVIAVGGAEGNGTYDWKDDTVREWSSCGDGTRNPDLVAPGKSIVSLRAPGSTADLDHPEGRVGATPRFFRGSGTSQAAAVVSGAAALVIQQRPLITPDGVKLLLTQSAQKLTNAAAKCQGSGMLNLKLARDAATPLKVQTWARSAGTGSLESARGSEHLVDGTVELRGEIDIFRKAWNGASWATASLAETSWSGGLWRGNRWSGDAWSGNRWSGAVWTGNRWSGNRWSDVAWSGNRWSGNRWSDSSWTGNRWSGNRWSGNRWSSTGWGG